MSDTDHERARKTAGEWADGSGATTCVWMHAGDATNLARSYLAIGADCHEIGGRVDAACDHAAQMERERDEARAEVARLREVLAGVLAGMECTGYCHVYPPGIHEDGCLVCEARALLTPTQEDKTDGE